ncbi:hypothetical protein QQZ08_004373 [Neonectria magnoliae]|uniref:Ecp2 effector protein-like domain-containing protein n=1 Tax=Neonectria magnoliae TaxID=2732573 RepID=A0ABR1I6F5_9HYPO
MRGKNHDRVIRSGSCSFGVEATKEDSNINFKLGGQDIIVLINEPSNKYGGSGLIGATGRMKYNRNFKKQDVEWSIY